MSASVEYLCEVTDTYFSFYHSEQHTVIFNSPQIVDAYFAKKVISKDKHKESGMKSYQFRNNNTITAQNQAIIINTYILPRLKETNRFATFESVKDVFPIGYYKAKTSITVQMYEAAYEYEKRTESVVGSEVYLVAETKYFKDGDNITFKIYESSKMLVEEGKKLPVLKGNSEETEIKGSVTTKIKYFNKNSCSVDDDKFGEVVMKIKLRPKSDKDFEDWKEKFKREEGDTEDKKDLIYLKVSSTTYENVDEKEFLVGDELEIFNSCYCNRDFTEEEIKSIIKELRDSEKYKSIDLFTSANCSLSSLEKTYGSFTKELNSAMTKYKIDTCIRKMHFLVQIYHETDRLKTTKEYGKSLRYDPYRGRGLMQLTWKNNYEKYKKSSGEDVVTNYNYVSDKLSYAVDSGGWYWENGSAWGGLNKRADNDDIYKINIGVNGGFNGFKERIMYAKKLIPLMKIESCKSLKLQDGKELGVYKYSTSSINTSNYGKTKKSTFEGYDD